MKHPNSHSDFARLTTCAMTAALVTFLGCGGAMAKQSAAPGMASTHGAAGLTRNAAAGGQQSQLQEQLVIEGEIAVAVQDVPSVAVAIREFVRAANGRIVREELGGGAHSWSGSMKVSLPPEKVTPFVTWLEDKGEIERKDIRADDVSRQLFDQKIALDNLELTLARLRKLLEHEQLATKDILEIEKEMTRIRGDIERIKGERRFLQDRVAYATLDIRLSRSKGAILKAKAKFYPGVRATALVLLDPDGRKRTRFGGGVVIHFEPDARSSLEVDVFRKTGEEKSAVIATLGGATYSDFLGRGRRCFLNPYLGLRIGYGYLGGSAFVAVGEAGVELYKHKYLLVDANLRVTTFIDDDGADVGLVAGSGIVVPF